MIQKFLTHGSRTEFEASRGDLSIMPMSAARNVARAGTVAAVKAKPRKRGSRSNIDHVVVWVDADR